MAAPVCLVTILYNSGDGLPGFLACLQAQALTDWRMIVIDNASPDGSLAIVSALADPRITVIRNSANLGFAKAANQGLRAAAAAGEFAVLFNNDTWFAPDFLHRLVEARARLSADVIAPRVMDMDRPEVSWYAGGHLEDGWVFRNIHDEYREEDGDEPRKVGFASGCCLGLTPAVLARVGYFDESFFVYWEDVDFCMRLTAAGVPIYYLPEPMLRHQGAVATGGVSSPAHDRLYYRSYMQLLRKHFGLGRAARVMLRLTAKEVGQPNRDARHIRSIATSMAWGLAAPLIRAALAADQVAYGGSAR